LRLTGLAAAAASVLEVVPASAHTIQSQLRQPPPVDDAWQAPGLYQISGRVRLDDEVVEIGPMDAIRVAPRVTRVFEAGPDGLELLVFGPHHNRDAEMVPDFWTD